MAEEAYTRKLEMAKELLDELGITAGLKKQF